MVTLVVRLADLDFLSPREISGELPTAEIIEAIRQQFDYLPGELLVEISDAVATIQFEGASAQERTEVRAIAFEVAMLGQGGLDYASPDAKYTLTTLPGETFTGLQLMCLMHAGFQRIAPEHDTGTNLQEPFLTALELFNNEERGAA